MRPKVGEAFSNSAKWLGIWLLGTESLWSRQFTAYSAAVELSV